MKKAVLPAEARRLHIALAFLAVITAHLRAAEPVYQTHVGETVEAR